MRAARRATASPSRTYCPRLLSWWRTSPAARAVDLELRPGRTEPRARSRRRPRRRTETGTEIVPSPSGAGRARVAGVRPVARVARRGRAARRAAPAAVRRSGGPWRRRGRPARDPVAARPPAGSDAAAEPDPLARDRDLRSGAARPRSSRPLQVEPVGRGRAALGRRAAQDQRPVDEQRRPGRARRCRRLRPSARSRRRAAGSRRRRSSETPSGSASRRKWRAP